VILSKITLVLNGLAKARQSSNHSLSSRVRKLHIMYNQTGLVQKPTIDIELKYCASLGQFTISHHITTNRVPTSVSDSQFSGVIMCNVTKLRTLNPEF